MNATRFNVDFFKIQLKTSFNFTKSINFDEKKDDCDCPSNNVSHIQT